MGNQEAEVISEKERKKKERRATKTIAQEISKELFKEKRKLQSRQHFFNSKLFKALIIMLIVAIGLGIVNSLINILPALVANAIVTSTNNDGTTTIKWDDTQTGYGYPPPLVGSIGTRILDNEYPVDEGLTAGTTKTAGSKISLEADESKVFSSRRTGLDGR